MSAFSMWPVTFDHKAKITVVKPNAKQANSQAAIRYGLYKSGMTAEQYVAACEAKKFKARTAWSDLVWDSDRGFVKIAGYEPTGASRPKAKAEPPKAEPKKAEKKATAKKPVRAPAGIPTPSATA